MSFELIDINFLSNCEANKCGELGNNVFDSFRDLGCNTNIKVNYLHSQLSYFPENLGNISEEQDERFHQDMNRIKKLELPHIAKIVNLNEAIVGTIKKNENKI